MSRPDFRHTAICNAFRYRPAGAENGRRRCQTTKVTKRRRSAAFCLGLHLLVAHLEIVWTKSATDLFFSSRVEKVPTNRRLNSGNREPKRKLVLVSIIALFVAGQLEMGGTYASPGAFHMRTFSKVVVWLAAAFVGFFLWNATPDFGLS